MKRLFLCAAIAACCVSGCAPSGSAPHKVALYSGGKPARIWVSEGRVEPYADGCWWFIDGHTGRPVRISGNVTVEESQ